MNNDTQKYGAKTNALKTIMDKVYFHRLPSYGNSIFFSLGFLALTCLVVLVASGAVLAFMGQNWWLKDAWGIYFRSIHLWTVQAFIAILVLHIIVGFLTSGYRPPRRMVWVFGSIIFVLALIQTEFGYGLRGDFESQYRAVSGADFWNGAHLGYWLNPLNYTQTMVLHISIIPLAIFFIFIFHYILEHTYGVSKPLKKEPAFKEVPADHKILFIRGGVLVTLILIMAFFFHSPYVPAVRISDITQQNPNLVAKTMLQEFKHTSDTATYFDSINPYTFDTRKVYITTPYKQVMLGNQNNNALTVFNSATPIQQQTYLQQAEQYVSATSTQVGNTTSTANPVIAIINTLMSISKNGLYETIISQENPSINNTYTLRFLNDMGVLDAKAESLNMDTAQWGMAKDETGKILSLPPGSWWLLPIGIINSSFNLLENDKGDQIAGEILGFILLIFILFPYIPYLNRIPEKLNLARFIQREPKEK